MCSDKVVPKELNNALGFNIYRVALLYKRELIRALAEYELTPEQWQTLAVLWLRNEPLSQNDIAQLTLRDKHTVSRMLSRMERNGWITRSADKEDKRITIVNASKRAKQNRNQVVGALQQHFEPITGVLTKNEQQTLLSLLKKLRDHLE